MKRRILHAVVLLVAVGCASMKRPYDAAGVDHILIGAASLDDGIRAFENATGVTPVRGGRHPSRGTENALASLGGVYVEIIAPQAGARPDEFIGELRALKAPAVVGWAVHVVDAADAAARLTQAGFKPTTPRPGSRVTPEGATLEWATFEVETPRIAGAPFFIRWGDATTHPSLTSPGGCSMTSFQVADPQGAELSRKLAAIGVAAEVRAAERPRMRLALRCNGREAVFD